MPVISCGGGKWRIGKGKCMYDSKAKAESAYRGYLYSKYGKDLSEIEILNPRVALELIDFFRENKKRKVVAEVVKRVVKRR